MHLERVKRFNDRLRFAPSSFSPGEVRLKMEVRKARCTLQMSNMMNKIYIELYVEAASSWNGIRQKARASTLGAFISYVWHSINNHFSIQGCQLSSFSSPEINDAWHIMRSRPPHKFPFHIPQADKNMQKGEIFLICLRGGKTRKASKAEAKAMRWQVKLWHVVKRSTAFPRKKPKQHTTPRVFFSSLNFICDSNLWKLISFFRGTRINLYLINLLAFFSSSSSAHSAPLRVERRNFAWTHFARRRSAFLCFL